jgi:hypothetical protein
MTAEGGIGSSGDREDPHAPSPSVAPNRWEAQSVLGFGLAAAVFVVPILLGFLAAVVLASALPSPRTVTGRLLWWLALIALPPAVFYVTDRVVKRWLPLAALLRMTMVFPDKAPTRMAVARKVGSTKALARRLDDAKATGAGEDVTQAAERILALATALNLHDRRTRGHSERVRTLADMIGEQMELTQADRERLRWSSLLHDVGKLTVHPEVLNKPGKLSDEEFAEIRNHPLEGAKLAAPLADWLGPWAGTIAEHHEKFDGSGYPRGLAGSDISLGGRIVAVADSYEVITAVRSYKTAASPEEARTELAACAGAHFDPDVVRAFLQISIGKLRRTGGLLAWFGAVFGPRASAASRRVATVGHAAATSAVVVLAASVAAVQQNAFGGPISVSSHLSTAQVSVRVDHVYDKAADGRFPQTFVIRRLDPATGRIEGTGTDPTFSFTGSVHGSRIEMVWSFHDGLGYVAKLTGKVQPDGDMSGTFTDNEGQSGPWVANLAP